MSQKLCGYFQHEFKKISEEKDDLRSALFAYKEKGNESGFYHIDNAYQAVQTFKEEYYQHAVRMLIDWYPNQDIKIQFGAYLKTDNAGRVIVDTSVDIFSIRTNHFPSLIKRVKGSVDVYTTSIFQMDYLEEIDEEFAAQSNFMSAEHLTRIGKSLAWYSSNFYHSFREVFPRLEKVGRNKAGVSIILYGPHAYDRAREIEGLAESGSLKFSGSVVVASVLIE